MRSYTFNQSFMLEDFQKVAAYFSSEEGTCFLFSAGPFDSVKKSMLWLFPQKAFSIGNHPYYNSVDFEEKIDSTEPFQVLRDKIGDAFWVGYLSYEMGAYSDFDKRLDITCPELPFCYFQRCLCILEYNHAERSIQLLVDDFADPVKKESLEYMQKLVDLPKFLKEIPTRHFPLNRTDLVKKIEDKNSYISKIRKAHEYIFSGDIYQVNLSHEISLEGSYSPYAVFRNLVSNNPSAFSAYFHFKNYSIVSNSPERLLCRTGNDLETRPIKGTIAKGKTQTEDSELIQKLLVSEKERAELVMITDLARNDLGKICERGSIKTQPFCIEQYEMLSHMLSIVKGRALPSLRSVDFLRSVFPGASITGCPKIRSQEIIHELEQRARNIYTGSIGYFTPEMDFDFNICIRTMLFSKNTVSFQLGGAIVADSVPENEYFETLLKGTSIINALNWRYES